MQTLTTTSVQHLLCDVVGAIAMVSFFFCKLPRSFQNPGSRGLASLMPLWCEPLRFYVLVSSCSGRVCQDSGSSPEGELVCYASTRRGWLTQSEVHALSGEAGTMALQLSMVRHVCNLAGRCAPLRQREFFLEPGIYMLDQSLWPRVPAPGQV